MLSTAGLGVGDFGYRVFLLLVSVVCLRSVVASVRVEHSGCMLMRSVFTSTILMPSVFACGTLSLYFYNTLAISLYLAYRILMRSLSSYLRFSLGLRSLDTYFLADRFKTMAISIYYLNTGLDYSLKARSDGFSSLR